MVNFYLSFWNAEESIRRRKLRSWKSLPWSPKLLPKCRASRRPLRPAVEGSAGQSSLRISFRICRTKYGVRAGRPASVAVFEVKAADEFVAAENAFQPMDAPLRRSRRVG